MATINCGFADNPRQLASIGPTIFVAVGYDPNYGRNGYPRPNLPDLLLPALIDTGAVTTCIDDDLATDLNLPVFERENVAGVHGPGSVTSYRTQIYLPELDFTHAGNFVGALLSAGRQRHRAIIGRDFLRQFRLIYDGPTGAVTISSDP